MGSYYGTTGMWYFNDTFYEVDDTHVNFFLNNPEVFGFSKKQKEELLKSVGLKGGEDSVGENEDAREKIIIAVMKKGAIRIRFYSDGTSVQCYKISMPVCKKNLKNCIQDGMGKCFGMFVNVMDCFDFDETLSKYEGMGDETYEEFIGSSVRKSNYVYINNIHNHSFGETKMKVIKSGNTGRVLEGEEKNAVLREALKQQGYSDSDIATMLGQSKKSIKSSSDEFDDENNFVMKPTWRKNSEYENIGESDEDVKNEVRDAYDESKGAYEFNSRKASNGKKSIKSVRVVKDMNFRDFEPWSGAKSTYDVIMSEGKDDEMDAMLDEMYPDGLTDTELNDLLWFDSDSVFEWLGIKTGDSGIPDDYDFEEDEHSSYPRARRREESDDEMLGNACKKNSKKKDKKKKKSIKSGVENGGRVLEGEEKNKVLRMALKQQGYSDSDIGAMLGQNRKSIKSMANYSLEPQRDSRKSFYGKARVDTGDDNSGNKLYSYDTLVAEIIDGEPVLYDKWDYSPTTIRHVREWLDQNGFEVGSKEFISKTYRHA